jgi:hypothetical protein
MAFHKSLKSKSSSEAKDTSPVSFSSWSARDVRTQPKSRHLVCGTAYVFCDVGFYDSRQFYMTTLPSTEQKNIEPRKLEHPGSSEFIAIDEDHVATLSNSEVRIWDDKSKDPVKKIPFEAGEVKNTPIPKIVLDGRYIIGSKDFKERGMIFADFFWMLNLETGETTAYPCVYRCMATIPSAPKHFAAVNSNSLDTIDLMTVDKKDNLKITKSLKLSIKVDMIAISPCSQLWCCGDTYSDHTLYHTDLSFSSLTPLVKVPSYCVSGVSWFDKHLIFQYQSIYALDTGSFSLFSFPNIQPNGANLLGEDLYLSQTNQLLLPKNKYDHALSSLSMFPSSLKRLIVTYLKSDIQDEKHWVKEGFQSKVPKYLSSEMQSEVRTFLLDLYVKQKHFMPEVKASAHLLYPMAVKMMSALCSLAKPNQASIMNCLKTLPQLKNPKQYLNKAMLIKIANSMKYNSQPGIWKRQGKR